MIGPLMTFALWIVVAVSLAWLAFVATQILGIFIRIKGSVDVLIELMANTGKAGVSLQVQGAEMSKLQIDSNLAIVEAIEKVARKMPEAPFDRVAIDVEQIDQRLTDIEQRLDGTVP